LATAQRRVNLSVAQCGTLNLAVLEDEFRMAAIARVIGM
jgi:hypothetical protein